MRALSVAEQGRLLLTLPELRQAELKFRAIAADEGIEYEIPPFGGSRTEAEQAQLIKWRDEAVKAGQPYYAVASLENARHPHGGAFDVRIIRHPWDTLDRAYEALADLAPAAGLRAGYYFPGKSKDPYHFELPISMVELKVRFADFVAKNGYQIGASGAIIAAVAVLSFLLFRR